MSSWKLWHYFKAHTIKVLTKQPLNDIFGNIDSSVRISKWAMELSEYVIDFETRNIVKSQVQADFVAEWTEPGSAAVCVFFAQARYRVIKIACSCSEMVLQTIMKYKAYYSLSWFRPLL
jgi:hypothetical protein